MKKQLESYRKEFPITSKCIFLDHAAVSPLSNKARRAVEQFLEEDSHNGSDRCEIWSQRVEEVRKSAAKLVGAQPQEIAFVPNTSTGICNIANGLSWYDGENVVTFAGEFPANVYPWMNLKGQGVGLKFVPEKAGRIPRVDIPNYVDNHTKLLAASSVEFLTGYRNDLEKIGAFCREEGVLFSVDGIQSLGVFPMDVNKFNIDFLAADGHKWLLGPEGAGILYVSSNFLDRIDPAIVGWKSMNNARDFLPYQFDLRKDAARFEPGSMNYMGIFAMGASISLLLEVGIENIASRIIELTDRLAEGLKKSGWTLISPRKSEGEKSGIVTFKGKADADETAARLAAKGIMIGSRQDLLRVSPHFYNTFSEVDDMLEALGDNPA